MKKKEIKAMADRIKFSRKKLGYTQESFCEVIGISIGSYAKIENAFQKPSLDTLIKISERLNVSLDYLVFGEGDKVNTSNIDVVSSIIENADIDKLQYVGKFLGQISKLK